jgi:hypothetical protein
LTSDSGSDLAEQQDFITLLVSIASDTSNVKNASVAVQVSFYAEKLPDQL